MTGCSPDVAGLTQHICYVLIALIVERLVMSVIHVHGGICDYSRFL